VDLTNYNIKKLNGSMGTRSTSILKDANVANHTYLTFMTSILLYL